MIKYLEYSIYLNTDFINKQELFSLLSKVGMPLINSIKNDIYKLFFAQQTDKKILFNEDFEVFVKDKILAIIDVPKSNLLKLIFVIYNNEYDKIVESFKKLIEKYFQSKNINFHIEIEENKVELLSPIDPSVLNNMDIEKLKIITNENYEFIKKIGSLGTKIYKADIFKVLDVKEQLIEDLISKGLIEREYGFICRETGKQVISLQNLDVLNSASGVIKCFYCGKSIKEEIMEEIISLNSIAKEVINDNLWIVALVYKYLTQNGISEIQMESIELGKIIIISNIIEPLSVIILNKNFRIHNTFLLDVYIANYKTKYVVLIYPSKNAKIIRDYLENKGLKVILIDNYDNIGEKVLNAIEDLVRIFIKDKISQYDKFFSFKISDLISREYPVIKEVEVAQ